MSASWRRHTKSCLLLIAVVLGLAACSHGPDIAGQIPKPAWWDQVDAPVLANDDQVSKLWQSKPRCCVADEQLQANNHEFYKACAQSIDAHPDDADLVTKCMWLMPTGAERGDAITIRELLVRNYFDFDRRTDNCAHCAPADLIARASQDLAANYASTDRLDEALQTMEKVLDKRADEMSPWVQTELVTFLGRLYLKAGVTQARWERLDKAHGRLAALRGDDTVARRFGALDAVYQQARRARAD